MSIKLSRENTSSFHGDVVVSEPFVVCTLAHPQIVGFSVPCVWDFSLGKNNSETMKRAVKLIETGDGSNRQLNLINEFAYSVALDNGFKVSTTCSTKIKRRTSVRLFIYPRPKGLVWHQFA